MSTRLAIAAGLSAALALGSAVVGISPVQAQGGTPRYRADVTWPKPLPDRWVIGGLGGLCVDANDHVLILNRQDVLDVDLNAGRLAPPIIEFDPEGNVVHSWGDLTQFDPRLHSCHFDGDNNLWIASSPSGVVQKFSHDGKTLLLQVGKKGVLDSSDGTEKGTPLNSDAPRFFLTSGVQVDRRTGEIYVSDGEGAGANRRILVLDKAGRFLRQWKQEDMETVHCIALARDGRVYVCNRTGSQIRVFDGKGALTQTIAVPWTPATPPAGGTPKETGGSAVAIDFSPDAAQRLMFVINQNNAQIEIFERLTGKKLGAFGRPGSFAGELQQPHGIAVDSKGNVYIAENRGRRVQKFVPVR